MSNFLGAAAVTATLVRLLQKAIDEGEPGTVAGATVTNTRPDIIGKDPAARGINIFLYQVSENVSLRSIDAPTRSADGTVVERPRTALDLHYLLSFYGTEKDLEPQRLMGLAVRTLRARPVLTRDMIQTTVAHADFGHVAFADLADDLPHVRLSPVALSLEEASKLWSVFFQTPYALSIAYVANVVIIEGVDNPRTALPVKGRNLYVVPTRQPFIEKVLAAGDPHEPILWNSTLHILGRGLRGAITRVRLRGHEVEPTDATDTKLVVSMTLFPAAKRRAGVQGIQVIQPIPMGKPEVAHRGFESNVGALVLRPSVQAVAVSDVAGAGTDPRSAKITVTVNPPLGKGQRPVLLLNQNVPENAAAYSFAKLAAEADAAAIEFDATDVVAGQYFVRVQIDGAESPITPTTPGATIP